MSEFFWESEVAEDSQPEERAAEPVAAKRPRNQAP